MASSLKVNRIVPSTGTNIGFGTANGQIRLASTSKLTFDGDTDTYINHPSANQLAITRAGASFPIIRFGSGGAGQTITMGNTTSNLVTNGEILSVRGYSSFKSVNKDYAAIYTHNEGGNGSGDLNAHLLFNWSGANRGGFGVETDNATLIFNNQNDISIRTGSTQLGGTEKLLIKSATNDIIANGSVGVNTDFTGSQDWRSGQKLEIYGGSGNYTGELHIGANRGDGVQSVGSINFFDNTQDSTHKHIALIEADKSGSTSNKRGGDLIFFTKKDNVAAPTEKLRIKSDGNVEIGGNIKTNNISGHNIVHNGAFNISQRGVGISSTATGFKTVDRWRTSWGNNSAPITQKHQALTSGAPYDAGFRYSYRIESTGHSGNNQAYCYLVQSIEARDIANSGWQYTSSSSYINLSFWVKANVSQDYLVFLHTNDTTIKEYCIIISLTANTWTKVTKAIPGNSGIVMNNDNGVGLQIWFAAYLGDHYTSGSTVETWQTHAGYTSRPDMGSSWWTQSNATFEVTGVQLELGSTDTPFEHRPYEEELRKCQRYFYSITPPPEFTGSTEDVGIGWATSGTEVQLRVDVPVVMRDTPTVEQVQGSNYFRIAGAGYGGDKYLSNNWLANNLSPNGGNLYTAPDTNLGSYIGQAAIIQLKNTAARLAIKSEI